MRKLPAYLLAILVGGIIWFFFSHFELVPRPDGEGTPTTETANKKTGGGIFEFFKLQHRENQTADNTGQPSSTQQNGSDVPPVAQATGVQDPVGSNIHDASTHTQPTESTSRQTNAFVNDAGPMQPSNIPTTTTNQQQALPNRPNTIRIGSFHLHHFGSNAADPNSVKIIAQIVRRFDIIALQGIAPGGRAAVIDLAREAGGYDVLLGSPAVVQHQDEQFAYLYKRETIVADRGDGLYTLGDENNLLRREPLIGWFRARKAPEDQAFTFSLVNINTDERNLLPELNVLDNAMFAIQNDGRLEDDVILLGNFRSPHNQLGQLGRVSGIVKTIVNPRQDPNGISRGNNIVFRSLATDEYAARADAYDYRRILNLSSEMASQISDYLPVYAEFSVYETGQPRSRSPQ